MKLSKLVVSLVLATASSLSLFADDMTQQIEFIEIDSFDNSEQREWLEKGKKITEERHWVAVGNKFATEENGIQYPQLSFVDGYPQFLFEAADDKTPRKILGIHCKFDRKGFNDVEIYPVAKERDKNGRAVSQPFKLPGIVKAIDFWAWGSSYDYTLEIHVRDYRGIPHVLDAGSLAFQGWRNIKVKVPTTIPQLQQYLPREQSLVLTKIVLRTSPLERVDGFYFFLDRLRVLTDMYQNPYDGRDLLRPEVLEKYFSTGTRSTNTSSSTPNKSNDNKGN